LRSESNIGAIQRRHRFLLFGADNQNDIVKSAHNPLRGEQDGERAGSAGRLGMRRRNAMQLRIDLRQKRAEMQLFGELTGVEIADRAGVNFAGIDLGGGDRVGGVGLAITSLRDAGVRYAFNIPGLRRDGASEGVGV
jgi:hypothetical protein